MSPCSSPLYITVSDTVISTNPSSTLYLNFQSCTWTITAPVGLYPTVTFSSFATELNYDFFSVYSGSNTSNPLFSGSGAQIPSPITGDCQQLLVTFTSDSSVVASGVRATVTFGAIAGTTTTQAPCSPTCSSCLSYRGGPVLTRAVVNPVYWNSNVAFSAQLSGFYSDIFNSTWFGNFAQYNVLPGSRGAPYVGNLATGTYTDAQVQAQLQSLINSGAVMAPTSNTYYPIHFPPGVSINMDGSLSCTSWCAYHSAFVMNGVNVAYGIIPDQGPTSGCAGGCGANPLQVNNLISVSSHELIEALTDPVPGWATGWYNNALGEIGDICNAQQTTFTSAGGLTYVVQKEWSNCARACV